MRLKTFLLISAMFISAPVFAESVSYLAYHGFECVAQSGERLLRRGTNLGLILAWDANRQPAAKWYIQNTTVTNGQLTMTGYVQTYTSYSGGSSPSTGRDTGSDVSGSGESTVLNTGCGQGTMWRLDISGSSSKDNAQMQIQSAQGCRQQQPLHFDCHKSFQ